MARFKKTGLNVGDHHSPDGVITVTPERIKHWSDSFKAMTANRLKIPAGWDHAEDPKDALPVTVDEAKKRSSKDGAGYLVGIEPTKDGNSAIFTFDVPDPKDEKTFRHNLAQISPVIFEKFTDGKKNEYLDCITHVDLVHHPVDADQTDFEPVAVACSIRMGLDVKQPKTYRFGFQDKQDVPTGGSDVNAPTPAQAPPEPTDVPENPDMPKNGPSDEERRLESVLAYLTEVCGVALPSDTDSKNFLERLQVALMTAKQVADDNEAEELKNNEPEDDAMPPINETAPAFAAMSLKANAAHAYAEGLHRESLTKRLDTLLKSGRCTPDEANKHEASLGLIRLSLTPEGKPVSSELEQWLSSREACPKGTFWDEAQRMSTIQEAAAPGSLLNGGAETLEEAEKLADEVMGKRHKR